MTVCIVNKSFHKPIISKNSISLTNYYVSYTTQGYIAPPRLFVLVRSSDIKWTWCLHPLKMFPVTNLDVCVDFRKSGIENGFQFQYDCLFLNEFLKVDFVMIYTLLFIRIQRFYAHIKILKIVLSIPFTKMFDWLSFYLFVINRLLFMNSLWMNTEKLFIIPSKTTHTHSHEGAPMRAWYTLLHVVKLCYIMRPQGIAASRWFSGDVFCHGDNLCHPLFYGVGRVWVTFYVTPTLWHSFCNVRVFLIGKHKNHRAWMSGIGSA